MKRISFILAVLGLLAAFQGFSQGPGTLGAAAPEVRMQYVLVSCTVSAGFVARERTYSLAFWTSAFNLLPDLPADEPAEAVFYTEAGPLKDQRLLNDVLANLAKAGLLKGVDISKSGDWVRINGWTFPQNSRVIFHTDDMEAVARE